MKITAVQLISSRFLRFCCIGGLGFIIYSAVTYAGVGLGIPSLYAVIPGIIIALAVCYRAHHAFTFRKEGKISLRGWYKFLIANGFGSIINYGCYAIVLIIWPTIPLIIPLAVGSGVALVANYILSVCYVFR